MDTIQHIREIIRKLPSDVKAEVVIAQLIESGIDFNKFLIQPKSVFSRSYRKDIISVQLKEFETTHEEYIQFDVSRQGLYDYIPEGLVHQPIKKKHFRSTKEKAEEVRRHREEEADARTLFLPYELEIYRQRILLELEERNTLVGFSNPFQHDWFIKFWGLSNKVQSAQIASLLYLLPISHKIVGNLKLTELCFQTILGEKVSIEYIEPMRQDIRDYLSPLGDTKLGVSFVIGDELNEGIPAIEVKIGPLIKANVIDYLDGGSEFEILKVLYRYFLAVDADVKTTILVKEEQRNFILSEDNYITHIVKQDETLDSISRSYNGVTPQMIKEKNNLNSDTLKVNQTLLIKYTARLGYTCNI